MDYDVFISYHTKSARHITEAVCNELEGRKIRCWYAPRNTMDEYASSIADVINNTKIFLLILNKEASKSFDCLNEINLACERIRRNEPLHIIPFQLDSEDISNDAKYYLGRFHWIDAITPPLESRIKELADRIEYLLKAKKKIVTKDEEKNILHSTNIVSNPYFIGRDKEIESLHNNLKEYGKVFLYGMGGIGKSEIAKKYANLYKKEYDTVIFSLYEKDLISTIINDKFFQIDNFNKKKTENGEESDEDFFKRKLEEIKKISDNKTLIILDNFDVDDDKYLKDLLEGEYHLIITTRNNFKRLRLPIIEVKAIENKEELLKLFMDNYELSLKEEEIEIVKKIIEVLEGHTLAIELVANVMQESRIKPEKMLETIKNKGISEIKGEVSRTYDTYDSVYDCISLVFDLSMLTETDKLILKNLSMFPLSGVNFEDFMELANIDDGVEINKLIKRNIIKNDYVTDNISLHPLILSVINNELKPNLKDIHELLSNLAKKYHYDMTKDEYKYVKYFENIYDKYPDFSIDEATYFREFVRMLGETDKSDLAIEILYKIKKLYEDSNKFTKLEIGKLYYALVYFYNRLAKFDEALKITFECISIAQEENDKNFELDAYNGLVGVYIDAGNYEESEKYLKICFKLYKENNLDMPVAYYYMKLYEANIEIYKENYQKALEITDECLELSKIVIGREQQFRLVSIFSRRGLIYIGLKDYDKAIEEFLKAKKNREESHSMDEVGLLRINNYLAGAYIEKKEYEKAMKLLLEIKQTLETKYVSPKLYKEVQENINKCRKIEEN